MLFFRGEFDQLRSSEHAESWDQQYMIALHDCPCFQVGSTISSVLENMNIPLFEVREPEPIKIRTIKTWKMGKSCVYLLGDLRASCWDAEVTKADRFILLRVRVSEVKTVTRVSNLPYGSLGSHRQHAPPVSLNRIMVIVHSSIGQYTDK